MARTSSSRSGRAVLHGALLGLVVACASSNAHGPATDVRRAPSDPTVLGRAELAGPAVSPALSLYEVVRQLRPLWLNDRGARSINYSVRVQVALDGRLVGDVGVLRGLRAGDVEEVRILDAGAAAARYGPSTQAQRVIELTSRRGRAPGRAR